MRGAWFRIRMAISRAGGDLDWSNGPESTVSSFKLNKLRGSTNRAGSCDELEIVSIFLQLKTPL